MTPDQEPRTDGDAPLEDGPPETRETGNAAAEAGAVGGPQPDPEIPEAERPPAEAGEGESEGFELAEDDLVERASHGDQHAARRVIEDADQRAEEPADVSDGGEADEFESGEVSSDR